MRKRIGITCVLWLMASVSMAQVPDLLNALDAGGRSMGSGGALNVTNADTLSTFYNPAGLGYLDKGELTIAYRNLPTSRTSITNSYNDPDRSSRGSSGSNSISHIGYAIPFSGVRRGGTGTLAISYTVGGYIDDVGTGPAAGLPDGTGGFTISNYEERRKARSDFYTIAYGRTNAAQNLSYGIGLIYAQQSAEYSQSGTSSSGVFTPFDLSSNGGGFGVIGGVQYIPPRSPNLSLGLSVRSPIQVGHGDTDLYSRIPGRVMLGGAYRREGYRGGKDFLVFGAQIQYFYGGASSFAFDRSTQTVGNVGLEYSYGLGEARLPFRIGYMSVPGGGDAFGARNAFTYGIGYRPNDGNYSIDLSWATPQGGGNDFALTATYRFR